MATPDQVELIKNELNFAWADAAFSQRVARSIDDGIAYLNDVAGGAQDYNSPGRARSLLINYCRYDFAESLDEFSANYQAELLNFRLDAQHQRGEAGDHAQA